MKKHEIKLNCSYEYIEDSFKQNVKFLPTPLSFFFHRQEPNFGKLEYNRILLQINFGAIRCKRDWKWILNQQMAPSMFVGEIERIKDGLIVRYYFRKTLYASILGVIAILAGLASLMFGIMGNNNFPLVAAIIMHIWFGAFGIYVLYIPKIDKVCLVEVLKTLANGERQKFDRFLQD